MNSLTQKHRIKKCFNKAVNTYDQHCHLQTLIGQHLIDMLPPTAINKIIDIGCGTGLFTQKLLNVFPNKTIYAIDIADHFLNKAKNKLISTSVKWLIADYDKVPLPDQQFDLAVSNMALHWSADLTRTLIEMARIITKHGVLAFSMSLAGTFLEIQPFSIYPLLTYNDILKKCAPHFDILNSHHTSYPLDFPNLTSALRAIKKTGANYSPKVTPNQLHRMPLLNPSPMQLTYVIGYFIARKK